MTTVTEAADKAGVSENAVRAWCRTGQVTAVKAATGTPVPSEVWNIDMASLDAHLARVDRICAAFIAAGGVEFVRRKGDSARDLNNVRKIYLSEERAQEWCGVLIEPLRSTGVTPAYVDGRRFACEDGGVGAMRLAVLGVHLDAADLAVHIRDMTQHPVKVIWADTGELDSVDMLARLAVAITERTGLHCGEPVTAYKDHLIPVTESPGGSQP